MTRTWTPGLSTGGILYGEGKTSGTGDKGARGLKASKNAQKFAGVENSWSTYRQAGNQINFTKTLQSTNSNELLLNSNTLEEVDNRMEELHNSDSVEHLQCTGISILDNETGEGKLLEVIKYNKFITSISLNDVFLSGKEVAAIGRSFSESNTVHVVPEPEPFADPPNLEEDIPEEEPTSEEPLDLTPFLDQFKEKLSQEFDDDHKSESPATAEGEGEESEEDRPDESDTNHDEMEEKEPEKLQTPLEDKKQSAIDSSLEKYKLELESLISLCGDEHIARHTTIREFFTSLPDFKKDEIEKRQQTLDIELSRLRTDAERRTGWSHVNKLNLSYNKVELEGMKGLADMLREKVPKTEEEIAAEKEAIIAEREAAAAAAAEAAAKAAAEAEEARAAAAAEVGEEQEGEPQPETAAEPVPEPEPLPEPDVPVDRCGFTTLTHLNLTECSINSKQLCVLSTVLGDNNKSLLSLTLSRNKLGWKKKSSGKISKGVQLFSEALKKNTTLTHLDMSGNELGPASCAKLLQAITENSSVESLILDSNLLGGSTGGEHYTVEDINNTAAAIIALNERLQKPPGSALSLLSLRNNNLNKNVVDVTFSSEMQLRSLDLSFNKIDNESIAHISKGISQLSNLSQLDVSGNNIGGDSLCTLLSAIPTQNLKEFSISQCLPGTVEVMSCVADIVSSSSLEIFHGRELNWPASCESEICRLFNLSSHLKSVYLCDNALSASSMIAIMKRCRSKRLQSCSLWSREMGAYSPSDWSLICEAAKDASTTCSSLSFLDLGIIPKDSMSQFAEISELLSSR